MHHHHQPARIDSFSGPFAFLSNFEPAAVVLDGVTFPTVEHAYQAAKTTDPDQRARVAAAETPGRAKRAGAKVPLRDDWDAVRVDVMEDLVRQKFEHPELRLRLLATGTAELVEGNTWGDRFWGECGGEGDNHLGLILMRTRDALRS